MIKETLSLRSREENSCYFKTYIINVMNAYHTEMLIVPSTSSPFSTPIMQSKALLPMLIKVHLACSGNETEYFLFHKWSLAMGHHYILTRIYYYLSWFLGFSLFPLYYFKVFTLQYKGLETTVVGIWCFKNKTELNFSMISNHDHNDHMIILSVTGLKSKWI